MAATSVLSGKATWFRVFWYIRSVYFGKDIKTERDVALKLEVAQDSSSNLVHKYSVYQAISGLSKIPKVYWYGREGPYHVIVLNRLGSTLEEIGRTCIDTNAVFTYAMQMLLILESLHDRHYVHLDIKPDNFALGIATRSHTMQIYGSSTIGTICYSSINCHLGLTPSRRDDLESLIYVIVYLVKGCLPWQGITVQPGQIHQDKVLKVKQATIVKALCKGLPQPFIEFSKYIRCLGFQDKPDYNLLCSILKKYAVRLSSVHRQLKPLTNSMWPTENTAPAHSAHPPTQADGNRRNAHTRGSDKARRWTTPLGPSFDSLMMLKACMRHAQRATDCLEDMSQSAIAHDGIFGFGDEKQNILAKKEFEEVAAKGSRPCPMCQKLSDISPNTIFLSSAFELIPKELRTFVHSEKNRSHSTKEKKPVLLVPLTSTAKVACRPPPPLETVELSSDDDMPDFKQILARSKKDEAHPPLPRLSFRHPSHHRIITRISEHFMAISTSPYTPHQQLV
ncbi:kinase-like domain-containing protein [Russula emetica]|nr:kinase-like domain-containing protein [Russula emetica]